MIIANIETELQQLVKSEQAWHYRIVPKNLSDNVLELWIDEEQATEDAAEELEVLLGKRILLAFTSPETIQQALYTYYRKENPRKQDVKALGSISANEDFLVTLIREARNLGSSDIHIETYEGRNRVRIRIDGLLVERYTIPHQEYQGLINKVKIKARLDISEKRLPQDGRIYHEDHNEKFDLRVSVLPTLYGEKIVMRILRSDASEVDLQDIGFSRHDLMCYMDTLKKPHGIILVSGPTGSGKTTTLYATLKLLNKESRNILTVEDPIEYTLAGVNQVQVKENIGLSFASVLRSFLRQDPDVIMVGEIRDAETAAIAIRAALTGHLVLSTIHTNSAWGTISRLIDMGMQPFLIANTLNASLAQRLIRLLCQHCKRSEPLNPTSLPLHYRSSSLITNHCVPKGCEECHYIGYKGRKGIFELIPIDQDIANLIRNNQSEVSTTIIRQKEIKTLSEQAFELFKAGLTSLEEVYPILTTN